MKFHTLFVLCFMALLVSAAYADTEPPASSSAPVKSRMLNDSKIGTLCWTQTATSTGCTYLAANGGNGDEIVADFRGFDSVTLYSNQSTATTYTCDLYTSDNGYDSDSGVGQDRTSTALTETQEAVVLSGALGFAWIECSGIADNQVTVTFVATR